MKYVTITHHYHNQAIHNIYKLFILFTYFLLTYARLLAGSMGHRSKLSTGSYAAPWLQFPARCNPSSSLPTTRFAAIISWPSSFPLSLGSPCQCLYCDARCRFSQSVTNQTPFSSFYFYFYWQLICLGPQSVVADFV